MPLTSTFFHSTEEWRLSWSPYLLINYTYKWSPVSVSSSYQVPSRLDDESCIFMHGRQYRLIAQTSWLTAGNYNIHVVHNTAAKPSDSTFALDLASADHCVHLKIIFTYLYVFSMQITVTAQ